MSHYAKVVNGIVETVIVVEIDTINEGWLGDPSLWIQTSYNTRGGIHYIADTNIPSNDQTKALRKNYAGPGYTYDSIRDAFIPPQPYPSWILDENTCLWNAPRPYPPDGKFYDWNEETISWVEVVEE